MSGTLRHKIALRRIRSRGHPRRGASLQPILPHSLTPQKSYALWPPGVALKSLFRCGTATPGEGPVPAPRDDDARNPMPAHSIPFRAFRSMLIPIRGCVCCHLLVLFASFPFCLFLRSLCDFSGVTLCPFDRTPLLLPCHPLPRSVLNHESNYTLNP